MASQVPLVSALSGEMQENHWALLESRLAKTLVLQGETDPALKE